MRARLLRLAWLIVLVGGLPATAWAQPEPAEYVGEQTCKRCHRTAPQHWAHTAHATVFRHNPRNELEARSCEACHGPGSAHADAPREAGNIIAFSADAATSVERQNRQCLQCHDGGERLHWLGSRHAVANVACSDCHNPMARFSERGLLAERRLNETCYRCHKEQRAQFRKRSHMPLPEGKMSCADCHRPHGSITQPLLAGETVNQVCYECHAEKRGPFIWEHAPVREDCTNCHRPHGSNHENLLITAKPFLCQQCHSQLGHPNSLRTRRNLPGGAAPDERLMNRSCTNCHSQIHGSNHPAGVKFHR